MDQGDFGMIICQMNPVEDIMHELIQIERLFGCFEVGKKDCRLDLTLRT